MAYPTAVNNQITDAITQSNITVLGDAPAVAMGSLYQVAAHALGLALQNATAAQQQMNMTAQAATTLGITMLLSSSGSQDVPLSVPAELS
jgi:hypothetical protein